jgi:hypothetical protein
MCLFSKQKKRGEKKERKKKKTFIHNTFLSFLLLDGCPD